MSLEPELLDAIADTALFYPGCGPDVMVPIQLFASVVSDFFFVDIKRPRCPALRDIAKRKPKNGALATTDAFLHRVSNREFRIHRWERRGEEAIAELPRLGVFFFRGDNPVDGEGSSGVLWLGGELFSKILTLLVPGGLVVTDGSNPGPRGPVHLSDFYHNREIRDGAIRAAVPFDYDGRNFTCVGYVGERYGPTLVWRVT